MNQIIIPTKSLVVPACDYEYKINLNNFVSHEYDITGIDIKLPPLIDCIELHIGGNFIYKFDHNNISKLLAFPIYRSQLYYGYAQLLFKYNGCTLKENEICRTISTYNEEIEFGDKIEIYVNKESYSMFNRRSDDCDINKYLYGRLVNRFDNEIEIKKLTEICVDYFNYEENVEDAYEGYFISGRQVNRKYVKTKKVIYECNINIPEISIFYENGNKNVNTSYIISNNELIYANGSANLRYCD